MIPPITRTVGGRYELRERLASGGMGQVWRAEDTVLQRPVAVKLLRPEYADNVEFRARLRWEARHAAGLSHPGLARVYDYSGGQSGEPSYLVMEFVDAESLSELLARERTLAPQRVLDIVSQVAAGLADAHRAGLVHRDIKPGNLLIDGEGRVKITDFGIAWAKDSASLTRTGEIIGTPLYLSPEQASGRKGSPASDLYSLGVIAYECLTGRTPFEGHPLAVVVAHRDQPMPPLPDAVPGYVATLVDALTAKDPVTRPSDAVEVARWARRLADDPKPAGALARPIVSRGPTARADGDPGPPRPARTSRTPGRRRLLLGIGAVTFALLGAIIGWDLRNLAVSTAATRAGAGFTSTRSAPFSMVTIDPTRYQGRPIADAAKKLHVLGLRTVIRYQTVPNRLPFTIVGLAPAGAVPIGTTITIFVSAQSLAQQALSPPGIEHTITHPRPPKDPQGKGAGKHELSGENKD